VLSCWQGYVALASACWSEDPQSRPSFTEIAEELERLRGQAQLLQEEVDRAWRKVSGFW
jgi:hypothetical protein